MIPWNDIQEAIATALAGRGETARLALLDCWDRTEVSDAAQRCVLAHYLADQQDSPEDELLWDERALAAHANVHEKDLLGIGVPSAAGFAPSLHLNLGDAYLRAGRVQEARTQLAAARATLHLLPADGYGAMIRGGIERLSVRIETMT